MQKVSQSECDFGPQRKMDEQQAVHVETLQQTKQQLFAAALEQHADTFPPYKLCKNPGYTHH